MVYWSSSWALLTAQLDGSPFLLNKDASSRRDAPEGAEVLSPAAARLCRLPKQEGPGYNVPCSLRHASAKSLKQSMLCGLLPLQGVTCRIGLPRVSLRLPWAMEIIGLSARLGCQGYALPLTFQPAWSIPLFVRAQFVRCSPPTAMASGV